MSDQRCTSEQATAAVGYLARCWGGFSIPDDEKRAFLRLFTHYPPAVVSRAIDDLVRASDRRPSPADLASKLRPMRPSVPDTRNTEPIPEVDPEHVSAQVRAIKEANALR